MKTILLSFNFFKQHWFANILIIIEVMLTLFLATILINRSSYIFETYNAFKDTGLQNSIYFMGNVGAPTENAGYMIKPYMSELSTELSKLNGIKNISNIGVFSNDESTIIMYDKETAELLKQKTDGSWLNDDENGIVAYNSKYKTGDTIDLEIELYNQFTLDGEAHTETRKGQFKINGSCTALSDSLLYPAVKTNKTINLEGFLLNNLFYKDFTVYFIPAENNVFDKFKQPSDSFILYLEDNVSAKDLDEIGKVLGKYGTYMQGADVLNKTYSDSIDRLIYDLYSFFSIASIAFISLVSISFLNMKKFSKYISIYYLNGCSFKKAMIIYLVYLFILLMSSIILYYGMMTYINIKNMSDFNLLTTIYIRTYQMNLNRQAISFSLVFIIMLIVSYLPFYHMSRKTRINLLKEN